MKNHVWRPLYIVLAVVALILLARTVIVPKDFGYFERGYMYSWHRKGNEAEWKDVKVKYRTNAYCRDCHRDKIDDLMRSPHATIMCEDCHGPALDHPKDPPTLFIDTSRELCVRCHFYLPYPSSGRSKIRGINPETHHPEAECILCHYPHNPKREAKR